MNYGLYLSASGVMVNAHRQDVLSNNLANVNTAGFKPMFTDLRQRPVESMEGGPVEFGLSNKLLDKLGGGVFGKEQRVIYKAGAAIFSGNDLDAALTQDNAFFAVEHRDAETGEAGVRLTRNGRFKVGTDGTLQTQTGHRVLDANDKPIGIDVAKAIIGPTGLIDLRDGDGQSMGTVQIQVARADLTTLNPVGENQFEMTAGDSRDTVDLPALKPRHYESSGTDAITTMMQIVEATKAATGNANMIRYHDQMLNASINTFARVA